MIRELPWEKSINGESAFCKIKHSKKIPWMLSRLIAQFKIKDISSISTSFKNVEFFFEPWVCIFIDSGQKMEFFGVYKGSLDDDDVILSPDELPSICLRKASWNQSKAFEDLKSSKSPIEYILGELQINSTIYFQQKEANPDIFSLAFSLFDMVKNGIKFEKETRGSLKVPITYYSIIDCSFSYEFSYNPSQFKSSPLEDWAFKWCECFNIINNEDSLIPDKKVRVSYRASLLEYMNHLE